MAEADHHDAWRLESFVRAHSSLSAHTLSLELRTGTLAVLDVQGFPLMRNWYVVHRRTKRLPPVAQAFKDFLLSDGEALIQKIVPLGPVR